MTDNKATQIKFFSDELAANDFMVDVEVVDIKFQNHNSGHWIMVIYKKWVSCSHESHFISSMTRCEKCGDDRE